MAKAIHASMLKSEENTQLFNTLITNYIKLRNLNYAHKCFASLPHPNVVSYTTLMFAYAKSGQEDEVVKLFSEMRLAGIEPNEFSFVAILTLCNRLLDLQLCSQVHAFAIKSDYCCYTYVCNALMGTYVKCGHLDSAISLLEEMPQRDLASWNTVLSGLVKELECEKAFELFRGMLRIDGFRVDHISLSTLLVAATESFDYMKGRECHAYALKIGVELNATLSNTLIGFYNRCHSLKKVVSHNEDPDALSVNYHNLLRRTVLHDEILVAKAIHALILKAEENTQHFNTLITTYIKLRNINYAHKCFVRLSQPNVVSYTTLMFAYAKSSQEAEAVKLFSEMRWAGIEPNEFSFVAILTVCNRLLDLKLGSQVHALAVKSDYCCYTYVCNALMGTYAKCGHLDMAIALLEEMPQRDLASWNTVLSGLVKKLEYERAFEFFRGMLRSDGFSADHISLLNLLVASTESFDYMKGRECHAYALKNGFGLNLSVCNALIGFYTKCGSLENVVSLFQRMQDKDVITWVGMVVAFMDFGMVESAVNTFLQMPEKNCIAYNALLAGFGQNGEGLQALKLFQGMLQRGMELSEYTLTSILNACAVLAEIEIGKQIHGFVIKFGFGSNPCVEAALLDMCTRCGMMANATKMFDRWSYKQNYSFVFTSMICGYGRNGDPERAISLFCRKQAEGDVVVDVVASTAALGLCGSLGAHDLGKQIHGYIYKSGFQSDLGACNATISMYSKCGDMEDAVRCFNLMRKRDIRSWNSLISGYLLYGHGDKALTVWSEMEDKGIEPDSFTFVLLLSAYRHTDSNLLDSCRYLFYSMSSTYSIEPTSEHYTSMVSVLSYWGCYDDAEKLIENMPFEPDEYVWRALLDSCRLRSKLKLGKKVAEHLVAMEPQNPSTFILVSNLYAASGRWNCFERIRNEMREKGLRKYPSRSWLIHENRIHSFYGRDKSHPASKEIYAGLGELIPRCIKAGYVPDTSFVQHDVDENQRKEFLFYHSAKLAVTYGILYTRTVRVVKNIQLCGDCHTFFRYASSVLGREISFRDTSGFHFFKDGECSCKNYWQ